MGEDETNHLRPLLLCIYYFVVNNLWLPIANVIHFTNQQHLIFCFKLFGNASVFRKLLY